MSQNYQNREDIMFLEPCVSAKNTQHSLVTPIHESIVNPPFFDEKNISCTDSSRSSQSQPSFNDSQELTFIESSQLGFGGFRFGTSTPDVIAAMSSFDLETPRLAPAIPFPSQRDMVGSAEFCQTIPTWVQQDLDAGELAPITSPESHDPVSECVQACKSHDPLGVTRKQPPDLGIPAIRLGMTPTRPTPMRGKRTTSHSSNFGTGVRTESAVATPATRAVYQMMERSGRARLSLFMPEFSPIVPRCGPTSELQMPTLDIGLEPLDLMLFQ
ncbi:hypothetical protein J8273_4514 [Carpediemonas membranifera]|uniref:Uncharacterized protein n=1 Tax=Carpediemonas membranifera TaxID=201153 RepID=A0A8J6B674_9EUKA|nr:hypothetical protein J8273_4514 [Carpediemonas membranifera]|eukprot:KAG9393914.1 hypothetical protein J8273_4514 [Carpediemonas membranifera]